MSNPKEDPIHDPTPAPMVGDWLDAGVTAVLAGPPRSFKTGSLIYMALSVATGEPWFDKPVHKTGPVFMVTDLDREWFGEHVRDWFERYGQDHDPGEVPVLTLHGFDIISDKSKLEHLVEMSAEAEPKPALVLLDVGQHVDGDEVAAIGRIAARIRDASGAAVIYAHTTGSDEGFRVEDHFEVAFFADRPTAVI